MFLVELKCTNCNKKLEKGDQIFIHTNVSDLNGITHLKNWAKTQTVYCKACFDSKTS
ncbi:hypothetical protein [Staphylococcus sp. 11261D007BR]